MSTFPKTSDNCPIERLAHAHFFKKLTDFADYFVVGTHFLQFCQTLGPSLVISTMIVVASVLFPCVS